MHWRQLAHRLFILLLHAAIVVVLCCNLLQLDVGSLDTWYA